MLIRRQDLLVLFFYSVAYSRLRNLLFRRQNKPVSRFVTFHDIPGESQENFRKNIVFLKENTNIVSIHDYFCGNLSSTTINVVITFDDGFKNWINFAVPILKELNVPAIFFISAGFVGLSRKDENEFISSRLMVEQVPDHKDPVGLTAEDVREIAADGFLIGGHTLNHINMEKITDIVRLKHEVEEDKKRLEMMAGKKIEYFSYPAGACNNPVVSLPELLRDCGYRAAVTTEPGFNSAETNPFFLRRELTGALMSGPVFRARVYGNYDAVLFLKKIFSGKRTGRHPLV